MRVRFGKEACAEMAKESVAVTNLLVDAARSAKGSGQGSPFFPDVGHVLVFRPSVCGPGLGMCAGQVTQ